MIESLFGVDVKLFSLDKNKEDLAVGHTPPTESLERKKNKSNQNPVCMTFAMRCLAWGDTQRYDICVPIPQDKGDMKTTVVK